MQDQYNKSRLAGLCVYCGGTPEPGRTKCATCNARKNASQRARNARRSLDGLCQCGNPSGANSKRCEQCLAALAVDNKRRYDAKKDGGICISCGKSDALPMVTYNHKKRQRLCERCWLKRMSTLHLGTVQEWPCLLELFEQQGGACAYSGRKLTVGVNASIDHKFPRSRFPDLRYVLSNLQWVDYSINLMKGDMTHDEFLETVKCIHDRFH